MQKDFDSWNFHKKAIDLMAINSLYREREIWWCALGLNVGSEDDGKNEYFERPVLLFRSFGAETSWVIPLSSRQDSRQSRLNYRVDVQGTSRTARLHQLRLVSNKRLIRFVELVSYQDFQNIRNMLRDII
jgi:mRNA interferase MazF